MRSAIRFVSRLFLARSLHATVRSLRILAALALAVALVQFITPASAAELLTNGSFEVGLDLTGLGHAAVNPGTTDLPGWTGPNGFNWYINGDGTDGARWAPVAQDGIREVNFVYGTGNMTLSQTVAVSAGTEYTVSYYNRQRGGGGSALIDLSVSLGTVSGFKVLGTVTSQPDADTIQQTTTVDPDWTHYSFTFTPSTDCNATLTLGNNYVAGNHGDNDGVFLDNVSVVASGSGLTATTTTLARGPGTVTPSTSGDALSFDVTVSGATPTGEVTLKDGGAGGTTLGTGTLTDGACTITTTALTLGTHDNIVAVYAGDSSFASSVSLPLDPAQVVNPGAAAKLAFTTQPGGGWPRVVWGTQPKVTVQDAFGNPVDSTASITLEIKSGTGSGTLSGTKTESAVNGVATFTDLSIDLAGAGYQLTATSEGLTQADSAAFMVAYEFIVNGSFEVGKDIPNPSNQGYTSVSLPGTDLPGWSGTFSKWYCRAPGTGTDMGAAQHGERAVNLLDPTGVQVLSQSFAVAAKTTYTVSYYEKKRGGGGYMDTTLSVAVGTVTGAGGSPVAVSAGPAASIVQTTAVNGDWTLHSFTFTPDTTCRATLTLGNNYVESVRGDNDGVFLDNVSVTGAPPPPPLRGALLIVR